MLTRVFLPLLTLVLAGDWRSTEFQKAKTQLDSIREKRNGQGVILELKRTSASKVTGYAEVRGHGAWKLSAIPKTGSSNPAKPFDIITWNIDGSFAQSRPLQVDFIVPENEVEMTFIMTSKDLGELMWNKLLPASPTESKIYVFYIPGK